MGPLEVVWSDLLLKSYLQHYLRLLRAESNQILKICSDGDLTASSGPHFQVFDYHHCEVFSLTCSCTSPHGRLCLLPLALQLCTSERGQALFSS